MSDQLPDLGLFVYGVVAMTAGLAVYLVYLLCEGTAVAKLLRLAGFVLVVGVLAFIAARAYNEYAEWGRKL